MSTMDSRSSIITSPPQPPRRVRHLSLIVIITGVLLVIVSLPILGISITMLGTIPRLPYYAASLVSSGVSLMSGCLAMYGGIDLKKRRWYALLAYIISFLSDAAIGSAIAMMHKALFSEMRDCQGALCFQVSDGTAAECERHEIENYCKGHQQTIILNETVIICYDMCLKDYSTITITCLCLLVLLGILALVLQGTYCYQCFRYYFHYKHCAN